MSIGRIEEYNIRAAKQEKLVAEQVRSVIAVAETDAQALSDTQKSEAMNELTKRAGKEYLLRRKSEKSDPDIIQTMQEAVAVFANAGKKVVNVERRHKHHGYLNGTIYYIYIDGTSQPFVIRCDTGAVYDLGDFKQKFL